MKSITKVVIIIMMIFLLFIGQVSAGTINNATTAGWTTNVFLNGSMWTGENNGSLMQNHKNDATFNISGLVMYQGLGANSGTLARNVNTEYGLVNITNTCTFSGNGTGSLNYTTGQIGNAALLDGINDYYDCGTNASLNIFGNITLTAWIKTTSSTDGLTVTGRGLTGTFDHTWHHYIGLGYNTFYYANLYAMAAADGIAGTVLINDGKWHHVVAQFNGTAISVYTDGKYDNSKAKTTTPTSNNNLKVLIGNIPGYLYYFNGSVDEVRIYNRALSATEISVLYNTSLRAKSMPVIVNQTASVGNVINATTWTFNTCPSCNASIYGWQNGTSTKNLLYSNITSGQKYENPSVYQFNSMDFAFEMNSNGSNTVFLASMLWNETAATSLITIPANSWGMFNNWSYTTTFSGISANESNDIAYTFYNVTSGEWDSYYPGYSWNSGQIIDKNNSVMGFFNVQTTITANTVTPWNTSITAGWNMMYLMGTTNQTLTAICTNMVNCTDIYYYNQITNDYVNTGTDTIQPNQGFLSYVNQTGTWIRSTI